LVPWYEAALIKHPASSPAAQLLSDIAKNLKRRISVTDPESSRIYYTFEESPSPDYVVERVLLEVFDA
jgi:hypothetical protein